MSLPEIATIIHSQWKTVSVSQKSTDEAHRLKELGNSQFKDKLYTNALRSYTKAIFVAPWPEGVLKRTVHELLQSLHDSKMSVAESIHFQYLRSRQLEAASAPLLAFCFGNRSAVLYELGRIEECLLDIERAISFGYPQVSLHKLHRRRTNCRGKLQEKERGSHNDSEKLFSAFESKFISIQSSPEAGRYTVVSCDVQPGEVVISEEPFAAILEPKFMHSYCSHCFKDSTTLIPCCLCCNEGYCSPECRIIAWKRHHWFECTTAHIWKRVDWMLQLCLRIMLRVDPEELTETIAGSPPDPLSGGYGTVYSLQSHSDEYADVAQKTLMEKLTDIITQCYGEPIISYLGNKERASPTSTLSKDPIINQKRSKKTDAKNVSPLAISLKELRKVFLHHMLQLRCNTHFITKTVMEQTESGVSEATSVVDSVQEVNIGSGVYPTASLLNHSCYPNAILRFTGNKVSVRVVETVTSGNEICISYGPQVGRMNKTERQTELKQKYFFCCRCIACSGTNTKLSNAEVVRNALLCPKCKSGPLPVKGISEEGDWKDMSEPCQQCGYVPTEMELNELCDVREQTRKGDDLATSRNDIMNLSTLLKCHKIHTKILHKHNLELAKTSDKLAQAYAKQGVFPSASHYCELSSQAVSVVYGERSIEASSELCKLAQLQFHSQEFDKARKSANLALDTMQVYHDLQHPDCIQLRELLQTLSTK